MGAHDNSRRRLCEEIRPATPSSPPAAGERGYNGGQPTSSSTELQPAAGSHTEQLGPEVQPRAAPRAYARAVRPSLVPGQGQKGQGQPGEPDRPSGSWASYRRLPPAKL